MAPASAQSGFRGCTLAELREFARASASLGRAGWKWGLENRKKAWATYKKEVRETGGRRIVRRAREQTGVPTVLGRIRGDPWGFLAAPFATARDLPHMDTLVSSSIRVFLTVGLPATLVTMWALGRMQKNIVANGGEIPGAQYISGLVASGAVDREEALQALQKQNRIIVAWVQDRSDRLPRMQDFLDARLLTAAEADRLDALARAVHRSVSLKWNGVKNNGLVGGEDFANALHREFSAALAAPGSPFHDFPGDVQEALGTLFWPAAKIGKVSDVALGKLLTRLLNENSETQQDRLNEDVDRLAGLREELIRRLQGQGSSDGTTDAALGARLEDAQRRVQYRVQAQAAVLDQEAAAAPDREASLRLKNIGRLMDGGLTLATAYGMIQRARENPSDIKDKLSRGRAIFPPGRLNSANRPDVPVFGQSLRVVVPGPGGTRELKDELDRWGLLLEDPRLEDLAQDWRGFVLSDFQVLALLEDRLAGTSRLLTELPANGKIGVQAARKVFGVGPGAVLNPLLAGTAKRLADLAEKAGLKDAELEPCLVSTATLWRDWSREELAWASAGNDARRIHALRAELRGARGAALNTVLRTCALPPTPP